MHDFSIRPPASHDIPDGQWSYNLSFTGKASEYFGIWIVNLLLTIVTLGIYSAWAKVRTTRYFRGNTWLDGHSFDYHASPKQILKGRLVAVGLLALYGGSSYIHPYAGPALMVIFFFFMPWLIVKSLSFNARMTSYRNVRFDFTGGTGKAWLAYLLYPALSAFTLFLAYPIASRAQYHFIGNNLKYGGRPFQASLLLSRFYGVYASAVLIFVAGGITMALLAWLGFLSPATLALSIPAYFIITLVAGIYIRASLFNILFNNLNLDGKHLFRSTINPGRMIMISLTNVLAIICSLGLLYPWARIRETRYRIDNLTVVSDGDISNFVTRTTSDHGSLGEEMADIFDIGAIA